MIKSFADEQTRRVFARERVPAFGPELQRAAWKKLAILYAAGSLSELRVPPAHRLEEGSGQRQAQGSIRINDQWRLCFRGRDVDALEVELVDNQLGGRSGRQDPGACSPRRVPPVGAP